MAENTKENTIIKSKPIYQRLEFIEKIKPRNVSKLEYQERSKYSLIGRGEVLKVIIKIL